MKFNLQGRLWAVARNVLSLSLCASLISLPVAAQDPAAQQSSQSQNPQPVARPIPQRTVGLEPGKVVKWTLRDAVMTALEKNVDIELERENVRLMQYDLIAAQGFYDPTTTSTILYNKSARATSFRAAGLDAGSNTVTSKRLTYNFGARKNFERWGTLVTADFNNQRLVSNTSTLTTEYSPSLTFQLTQPLFKNFEIDATRRSIKVIKKNLDLNDAQFRLRVIEIISQVQQAYWDLALAIRNEGVARESVTLAETQLNNNKRQVEVGTLAPIDVVSAATQLESRRQQVFQALNQVGLAENTLKALTVGGPNDDLWNSVIEPVEPFDVKPVTIPVSDAVKLAMDNRPEIKQQSLRKEINKIDVDFFRNQAKPQIDLVASYATNGLGGSPLVQSGTIPNCASPALRDPNNPGSGLVCNSIVVGRDAANNFIPAINTIPFNPAVPFTQTAPINNQFVGGYGTALGNLFKNEFRTWSVGVQFNFPLRNRTAKANLGKSLEQERQIDLQTRRLMQNIAVEVRNAVQSVETAKMRIDAAKAATEYARQQLVGEEKKFAAGLSSTFFILDRQNQLSLAQFTELQALADYNKSVATLQRVMSTTLSSNSIEIKADAPVTIK
ncbi:MAG: TolC family protein [Blastocatellales bacterium]